MSLDLEKNLAFYGAYHHNNVNVAIHAVCVPLILLTSFAIAASTGPLFPSPDFLSALHLEPSLGTIGALLYSGLYVLLEPVAGTALTLLCMAGAAGCNYVQSASSGLSVTAVAAVLHAVCWVMQIVGHRNFEHRAPALLDNPVQSLFLAPLFVWMELLFALGYRPELRARTAKMAEEDIKKWKESKSKPKDGKDE